MVYRSFFKKADRFLFALSITHAIASTDLYAEVITDGTIGPARTLLGPNFVVPQSLGSTMGNNLFHSFQGFNIANSESATFTGANSIQNVISRVTGGQSSTIDGLLRSQIGQADFYFINPAGVIFGPSAQVDVPAAFYISTATDLRFSDGALFGAIAPDISTLSMANPIEFGFLSNHHATILIERSELNFSPGSTVSLSASDIIIDSGTLISDTGEIRLSAVGAIDVNLPINVQFLQHATGNLEVSASRIETSGTDDPGRIVINTGDTEFTDSRVFADNLGNNAPSENAGIELSAGSLQLNNSFITSDTIDAGNAGTVDVSVRSHLTLVNSGQISSETFGDGNAGSVSIQTSNLTIDNQGAALMTGISSQANPGATGDAGTINLSVMDNLSIFNGGVISSSSAGGRAGSVTVNTRNLSIDGQNSDFLTGISSQTGPDSIGNAGSVDVSVMESLVIVNGGRINSEAFGSGDAGSVTVRAGDLTIDRQNSDFLTGISSQTNQGSTGNAGTVNVSVRNTSSLQNGGVISSSTFSGGDAGGVTLQAGNLSIDRQNGNFFTGISSQANTGSSGNAGTLAVSVTDTLSVLNGGTISSSTFSAGRAGSITVDADRLIIDRLSSDFFTGIASSALNNSSGQSGDVSINTNNLIISNGGSISIRSDPFVAMVDLALIQATDITIQSKKIRLETDASITAQSSGNVPASDIFINATRRLDADGAQITTAANQADGGGITITGSDILLTNSQVTTSVAGDGNGGDIVFNPNVLVLNTGFVQANTAGVGASGGNIQVDTEVLIASNNQLITGGNAPISFQAGINVIQAAAPDGVSGSVAISSPELDISGTLLSLDTELIDIAALVQDPCAQPAAKQSTLISTGRGGLPETLQDAQSVPLNRQRLQRLTIPLTEKNASSEESTVSPTMPDPSDGRCSQKKNRN